MPHPKRPGFTDLVNLAPVYARPDATEALNRVVKLEASGVLRPGLYYVALTDLVGSTKFGTQHGNEALKDRIAAFVGAAPKALVQAPQRNTGLFVKEIGDAVLLLFVHFPDLVAWCVEFRRLLAYADKHPPLLTRTIVHAGEVDGHGVNPIAVAIAQTFKTEKRVPDGAVVVTDAAYRLAWPSLPAAQSAFVQLRGYVPIGKERQRLHQLQDSSLR